jgi:hypothetical protein
MVAQPCQWSARREIMSRKWNIPECLKPILSDEDSFRTWLDRKAKAHVKRDKARKRKVTVPQYKEAILRAIEESKGRDFFTGDKLDWPSIGFWNNEDAKRGGATYRKEFWNLPTVDHDRDEAGSPIFRLCSWRMNDSKNDQSLAEFLELAAKVQKHRVRKGR